MPVQHRTPAPESDPPVVQALIACLEKRGMMDEPNRDRLRRRLARSGVGNLADLHAFLATGGVKPGVAGALLFLLPALEQPPVGPCPLLAHLADGGMGSVWLAEHRGGLAVLKTLREEFSHDRAYLRRFQREAQITAGLDHPNIVRYLDHGVDRGTAFLVLEFVRGGDVALLLKRGGAVAEADALAIVAQAVRGLAQAWGRSLVHRDVKPANLFIDPAGTVKVADFGLARSTAEDSAVLTVQGTTVGSPAYMSPEQIRGGALDWRSDAYACGCVLHTLLAGDTPFTGGLPEVFNQHLHRAPPDIRALVPGVGAATAELIARCLAKRPGERFAAPAELAALIGRARGGDAAAALSAAVVRDSSAAMACPPAGGGQAPALRTDSTLVPPAPAGAHLDDDDLVIPFPETGGQGSTTWTRAPLPPPAPAPAVPVAAEPPTAACTREIHRFAGDWTAAPACPRLAIACPGGTTLVLLAAPEAVLGKQVQAPVDLPLRDYPVAAQDQANQRISRRHLRIHLDRDRLLVTDLGSRNGTLVDGRMLEAEESVELEPGREHAVEIPGSVALLVRGLPKRTRTHAPIDGLPARALAEAPLDAVVITRPRNRPQLAYALVLRRLVVGLPGADLAVAGWEGAALELMPWSGRWIARSAAEPWRPLGEALAGRGTAAPLRAEALAE